MSGLPKRCVRQVHRDKRGLFIYWFHYILRPEGCTFAKDDEWVTVCWHNNIDFEAFEVALSSSFVETWRWEHRIYDMPGIPEGLTHVS